MSTPTLQNYDYGQAGGAAASGGAKVIVNGADSSLPNAQDISGITGLVKATAGALAAAVKTTDYPDPVGTYLVQTATGAPTNAQVLGTLASGLVKVTATTGVLSKAAVGTDYVSGWTTITVTGSAVTSVTFSSLNGDVDIAYEVIANVAFNSGGVNIRLQPNGVSTNQKNSAIGCANGGTPAGSTAAEIDICLTRAAGFSSLAKGVFWAHRGSGTRGYIGMSCEALAAASQNQQTWTAHWNEDATNLTSIVFNASSANGIGVGSVFMIRPI